MAEDAGSIFSEVRLRLDKLDADIKHAIGAMNEFGTKLVDISDRTANLFDKPYAQSIAKVESYIKSLSQAVEKGALTQKQAIEESIAVRKRELDFIAASAAKQGGYTDRQITDIASTKASLEKLEAEYKELGFAADKSGKKQVDVFGKLTSAIGAAAIVQAFRAAVAGFVEYDAALTDVRAATRATEDELRALEQAAKDAGKTTAFSAKEALKGIEALSKAGVSNADIMGGALTGALSLAAAGSLDVGVAAETAAAAMTQFGLSGKDASHVADLLAAAAGKSQGEVSDYAAALNQVGLVAAQTGLTIEETTAALAEFGAAGLKGSDAGTSFRTMLLALTGTSDEAKAKMAELGISAFDAQGKFVGLEKFAGILHESLKDLTEEERLKNMKVIFGQDAIRTASILYKEGAAGIRDWSAKVNDAGFAAETARIKNESLEGHFKKLSSAAENASNSFVEKLSPALKGLADIGTTVLNFIAGAPGPIQAFVAVLGILSGALLAGALAARGLGIALSASLGPIGIAVSAIVAIGAGIATAVAAADELEKQRVASMFKDIGDQSKLTGDSLDELNKKIATTDQYLTRIFNKAKGDELLKTKSDFEALAKSMGLTNDQLAQVVLNNDKTTESQKTLARSFVDLVAQSERLLAARVREGQALQAGKQAELDAANAARESAKAKLVQAGAFAKAIEYENYLRKTGVQTGEEALQNISKLQNDEIERIKKLGAVSGGLNAQQITEILRLQKANEDNAAKILALQNNISDANAGFANAAIDMQVAQEAATASGVEQYAALSDAASESSTTSAEAFDRYDKLRRESTVTTTADIIKAQNEIDQKLFDSFSKDLKVVQSYVSGIASAFQGLISALAELYAVDNENKLASIEEQKTAALESLDEQLRAQLEAAGVADETEKERAERQLAELEARLASETDADKRAALEEEITDAKKAVTKAKIEQDFADKVTKTNEEFENKKLQQQYQGELSAWEFKLASAIASVPVAVVNAISTGWQAGLPAGPFLAAAFGVAAGAAGAIQVAAISSAKPKPPARLQTGGIVLPQQGGVPVVAAENGSPELMLNGGASGQALLGQFAAMISDRLGGGGGNTFQLVVDGRLFAEVTAPYFEKGIVRLKL